MRQTTDQVRGQVIQLPLWPDQVRGLPNVPARSALRSLPIYKPMLEAPGATAVTMNRSVVYTALERGTVDGYGYIAAELISARETAWADVKAKMPQHFEKRRKLLKLCMRRAPSHHHETSEAARPVVRART